MPKQKFNTFDVAAEVAELRRKVLGTWLTNIYDLDDKRTFLLKFSRSGGQTESGEGEKTTVLLESGARFHTTSYARERRADAPSKFNMKLRMHLRGKRCNGIDQLGADRAVDFTFGAGDTEHHLILELYAQGNVVLCDADYRILTLLRPVRDDNAGLVMLGNHPYPRDRFRPFRRLTRDDVRISLRGERRGEGLRGAEPPAEKSTEKSAEESTATWTPKTIREALCRSLGHGPPVIDHAARSAGLPLGAATPLPLPSEDDVDALFAKLSLLDDWFEATTAGERAPEGFIALTAREGGEDPLSEDSEDATLRESTLASSSDRFDEFSPFLLKQHARADRHAIVTEGFDAALDVYFAASEQRAARVASERAERAASRRLEKVKTDQARRASQLEAEREKEQLRATLIEYNLDAVDVALHAVNSALAGGTAWDDLEQMIKEERRTGNPVAGMIKSMDLANNAITVVLHNHLDDEEEDEEGGDGDGADDDEESDDDSTGPSASSTGPSSPSTRRKKPKKRPIAVDLDLGASAYANARAHFERKKQHAAKHEKTLAQNARAVAAAERAASTAKSKETRRGPGGVSLARTPEWFEKFHWFVTPENCLVLSARDAAQADALVTKYLGPDDAYVHADVAGAPVTIVKAPPRRLVEEEARSGGEDSSVSESDPRGSEEDGWCGRVPPVSLAHAGAACLCRSSAWDSRAVMSAWWTAPDRVRKTTPEGDALAKGTVWTVGRKHFLPPAPLIMGFGYAFVLGDDASVARHVGERVTKAVPGRSSERTSGDETNGDATNGDETNGDEKNGDEKNGDATNGDDIDGTADPTEDDVAAPSSRLDAFLDGGVDFAGDAAKAKTDVPEDDPKTKIAEGDPKTDESSSASATARTTTRVGARRISAKERRDMKRMRKKGVAEANEDSPDAEATVTEDSGEAEDSGESSSAPSSASVSRNGFPKHEKKAPLPRGKAGKAKRAAAKYADQDDEDRELAVALAAAAGRASKKGGKGKKNAQKKNRRGDDDSDDDDVFDPVKAKTAKTARRDANGVERRQPGSGAKATEIGKTNATEIGKTNATAKDLDSDSEPASESETESKSKFLALDAARVAKIDRLVCNPVAEDDVAFAVPIVAPYVALQSARYKVKLTPGTQKKGKAAKHASDVLLRAPSGARAAGVEMDRATREADKALDERLKARMRAAEGAAGELAHIMCGNGVKVSVPAGVAKAINASRKNTGKGKGGK